MGELTLEQKRKVRKPLLWIGMTSISMSFAGLTSGYMVSRSALLADDRWLEFILPQAFTYATIAIVLSSITMVIAGRQKRKQNKGAMVKALIATLILGLAFVVLQILGAIDLLDRGLFFTGPESNTAISWVYVISFLHWLHVISGIIVLFVSLRQAIKGTYDDVNHQGLSLSAIYWHFLDALWIYLFLFLLFIR